MRLGGSIAFIIFLFFASSPSLAQSEISAQARQAAIAAFEEGQNAQERGDLNSAVSFYTNAISTDPSLFLAYYQRATALIALRRKSEAEADLKKVIEIEAAVARPHPAFARAHRSLGQLLLDRGMTDEAIKELGRAIELDPDLGGVRIYYASALIKSDKAALAVEHLRAAISRDESPALAYALLGVAAERLGNWEEAFGHYSRAIEMDASLAAAREGRARLFERKGEVARAIEDYSIAYRAQPSPELAIKLAGLHARAGQLQAAIQLYRGLLVEKPEQIALRIEMLRLMAENGQAEEALKEIDALVAGRPGNAVLLSIAGDLCFEDEPERAAIYYGRALETSPDDNQLRVRLGASLVRASRFEEAVSVLTDAIDRDKDDYVAHANLATALFKLKRYPQAASQFIWLLKSQPDVAASYFFLAISLDRMGDCPQAMRAYREFVKRADRQANQKEIEEANIRLSLLDEVAKKGKCKPPAGGKSK
ncbi:MAG: tetratricopeptide repeat protein [Blastocatellia bacterium]|nr:tetratricopeptide repeat protein [Blastocatellia bacterium]